MAKTKPGKKDLDSYNIKGTNKVVRRMYFHTLSNTLILFFIFQLKTFNSFHFYLRLNKPKISFFFFLRIPGLKLEIDILIYVLQLGLLKNWIFFLF